MDSRCLLYFNINTILSIIGIIPDIIISNRMGFVNRKIKKELVIKEERRHMNRVRRIEVRSANGRDETVCYIYICI